MPVDDLLRRVNFLQSAFESARVHTFWLLNEIADSALAANFLTQGEGSGQRSITWRFALRSIAKPIGFPRGKGIGAGGQIEHGGICARARADEKPTSASEGLRPGRQRDVVFALAPRARPAVGRGPMKLNKTAFLA